MSIYISLILHVFHCHRIDWDVFIKEAKALNSGETYDRMKKNDIDDYNGQQAL